MSCCAATCNAAYLQETASRMNRLAQDRILAESTELGDSRYRTEFVVPSMHCVACVRTIERALAKLACVESARANLTFKSVSIVWDANNGSATDLSDVLDKIGFDHHLAEATLDTEDSNEAKSLLLALAIAGFAAANVMLLSVSVWSGADPETAQLFHLISGLIAIPAAAFAGRPFFSSALRSLSSGKLNMDVPISLAVLLALSMSIYESITGGMEAYFDASVTLLFFLLIGRYLDQLMRSKARGAVARLSSLAAKDGVIVEPDESIRFIALRDIEPGMRLRVFPGERFPVNGKIVEGKSDLDCAHVSGESDSVLGEAGSRVAAGTLNLTAPLDIVAESDAEHSYVAELRRMMAAAESGRSTYVRIADRMAQIYAPAVHLIAFMAFLGWMFWTGGDWHTSIYTAIAVLIVTCPCALGLAVPVAHVLGANKLMQQGILMRDGTGLERLNEIDTVIFDKTGTLTTGLPKVMSCTDMAGNDRQIANELANASHHPNSRAIADFLAGTQAAKLTDFQEVPGKGVQAKHEKLVVRLGKPEWVSEIAASCAQAPASSTVAFAIAGQQIAGFDIIDEPRADTTETVNELASLSVKMKILSGDRLNKVALLANQLGISDWRAEQTPEDKLNVLQSLQQDGKHVCMIGDGVNDGPALAAGHVSFAPASASDVGRHAADFVFTRDTLDALPIAISVARFTNTIVRQNFGLAIAYNCIAVPMAVAGLVTPLIAAIAMSASSIVVVANSMRISAHCSTRPIYHPHQKTADLEPKSNGHAAETALA